MSYSTKVVSENQLFFIVEYPPPLQIFPFQCRLLISFVENDPFILFLFMNSFGNIRQHNFVEKFFRDSFSSHFNSHQRQYYRIVYSARSAFFSTKQVDCISCFKALLIRAAYLRTLNAIKYFSFFIGTMVQKILVMTYPKIKEKSIYRKFSDVVNFQHPENARGLVYSFISL